MHAVLAQQAAGLPVIDLMHDAPAHDPRAAAYLLAGRTARPARIFGDAPAGSPFWYGNSCGLVEIAAPGASAAAMLNARCGAAIAIDRPD
jgi:S-adenosylmethionine hydrolase